MTKIILGSESPRRKEILEFFGLPFERKTKNFQHIKVSFENNPKQYVCAIAEQKAACFTEDLPVLCADTIVFFQNQLFEKPKNEQEALSMLGQLSGKMHEVHSAVCIKKGKDLFLASEMTKVFFHHLTKEQIKKYLSHISYLDKAGAYAIQKSGSLLVKKIEGCFYNVMGLPLGITSSLLLNVGIDLWDFFD